MRGDFISATLILLFAFSFSMQGVFAEESPLKWKYPVDRLSVISVSEDGKYIAASSEKRLFLLDNDGKLLWEKYTGIPAERISMSKDGRYIAVGFRGTVKLYNDKGKILRDFDLWKWAGTAFSIHSIQVSSRNAISVTGSVALTSPMGERYFKDSVENLFFYDSAKAFELGAYRVADEVFDASVSENLRYIVVAGSEDDSQGVYFLQRNESEKLWYYQIWDYDKNGSYYLHKKKITRWEYNVKTSKISAVTISPGGSYVAVGYAYRIDFLDSKGNKLWSYDVGDKVYDISISENGNYVAVASRDKNVYVLDKKGKLLWKYETANFVRSVLVSPDGQYVAAESLDKNIYFFENRLTVPRIVILANSVDYTLASDFFEFLQNTGIEVIHADAANFDQYKEEKFIAILGGPDAPEGVGKLVREVLTDDEQNYLREDGNREMFTKTNIWNPGQTVTVIAGSDRGQTQKAYEESKESISTQI